MRLSARLPPAVLGRPTRAVQPADPRQKLTPDKYIYLALHLSCITHTTILHYIYLALHLSIIYRPTPESLRILHYGQFSEVHVCFCGLDSGNLNFETVRTNKQHICF